MTEHAKILARIEQLRRGAKPFCVATIIRTADATSAKAGAKALVTDAGDLEGYVGGSCVSGAVKRAGLLSIASGEPTVIRIKPNESVTGPTDDDGTALYSSGCPSGGTVDIFMEPMLSAPRVVVCGSSPVALALTNIISTVGLQPIQVAIASNTNQIQESAIIMDDFDFADLQLQTNDAVVVATQGMKDRSALLAALGSSAGYVGMVGSRKKIDFIKQQVKDEVSKGRLGELRGPAGLDLGAIAPEEIALSIVAEIIAFRRSQTTT